MEIPIFKTIKYIKTEEGFFVEIESAKDCFAKVLNTAKFEHSFDPKFCEPTKSLINGVFDLIKDEGEKQRMSITN